MKDFLEKIGGWKVAAFALLLFAFLIFALSASGQSPSDKMPGDLPYSPTQVGNGEKWIIPNIENASAGSSNFEKGGLVTIVLAVIGLVATLIRESNGRQKNLEDLIANQTKAITASSEAIVQNRHSDELRGQAIMTKLGTIEEKIDNLKPNS